MNIPYKPTEKTAHYDDRGSCNKCGSLRNRTLEVMETVQEIQAECKTKCSACGFEDYWAYGYFQSNAQGYNKSAKY